VSEGESQGGSSGFFARWLIPLLVGGGLLYLFGRARSGRGGLGGGPGGPFGNPFDFGKSQSRFQEVPDTGITFKDVAVRPKLTPKP
jgi:ATP-dependent Zn protease